MRPASASSAPSNPSASAPRMMNASPSPAAARGVVYRSLALPGQLPAGPLALPPSLASKDATATATKHGEVFWDKDAAAAQKRQTQAQTPTPSPDRKLPATFFSLPSAAPTMYVAGAPPTSFAVRGSLAAVESGVSSSVPPGVDWTYDAVKYAWRLASHDARDGSTLRVRVDLLRVPEKADVYVLDFSRFAGDQARFAGLILDVYTRLHEAKLAAGCATMMRHVEERPARPARAFAPPPALPADCMCPPSVEDDSDYASLRAACASPLVDVQLEALRCLCGLVSSRSDARVALASYRVADELAVVGVASRCADARRLVATALAALCEDVVARTVLLQLGPVDAVVAFLARAVQVDADADVDSRETRRQAARALAALAIESDAARGVLAGVAGPEVEAA